MTLYTRQGLALSKTNIVKGKPVHIRDRACVRCGGLGGSEKWRHTGWTCLRCGGKCVDPNRETVKLYSEDQPRVLNDRKAKLDAKRAVAKAEKDRIEAERVAAEKAEVISANQDFLDRIGEELRHGDNDILQSIVERVCYQAKDPTDRQVEVATRIMFDRATERARLAGACHVGTIGQRSEFELTLLYTQTRAGELPNGIRVDSHWSLFTDAGGRKIACTSAPWIIGLTRKDGEYEKGQKVRVKATVKKHETDKKGEPVTYINRPKPI
jgi:hypothetical protein